MKKIKGIFFTPLLVIGLNANAQESINASGGNFSTNDGSISYSLSQTFYIQKEGFTGSLIEGVQQPFEIISLSNDDFNIIDIKIGVYPNPTISKITLEIGNGNFEDISYQLYSITGKLIIQNKIIKEQSEIQMENLASSVYLLKIIKNYKSIKTFKIIKN
jgi:hypothetical protein